MGIIKIALIIILIVGAAYAGFIYGRTVLDKNSVEVNVPIKQDVNLTLDQDINFPLKTSIEVPVNKTIYIRKSLPINTSILIDTIVRVPINISGSIVYVDVPIKKLIPIFTILELNEPISISERIVVPINQNISLPVKKDIFIPIDTILKTRIPLPWSK